MARQKVKPACSLTSWSDVDGALCAIAECERVASNLESDMNAEIDQVKARYTEMVKPVQQRLKYLQEDVERFVSIHREEMGSKTKVLTFGQVGFRLSSKLKYLIPTVEIIQALKERGLTTCIKTTETIIKEQLRQQPADVLGEVGAYLHKEDEFWLETNQAALEEGGV